MIALHQKYLSLMNAASAAGAPYNLLKSCFCLLSVARSIDADCAIRLEKYKLTEGKFVLLFFLAQNPKGLSPSELSKFAGVTKATVTGLSDGLVKIGLAKRVSIDGDRRSFKLMLTKKGFKVAEQVIQEHGVWIGSLFEKFSQSNLQSFQDLLSLIWQKTDEGRSSAKLVPIKY